MSSVFSTSDDLLMFHFLLKHLESTFKLLEHVFLVLVRIVETLRRMGEEGGKLTLERVEKVGKTDHDPRNIIQVFQRNALFANSLSTA